MGRRKLLALNTIRAQDEVGSIRSEGAYDAHIEWLQHRREDRIRSFQVHLRSIVEDLINETDVSAAVL